MTTVSTAAGYSARLHRRPAFAVNSPAILCHQCYSFKDEHAFSDAAAYREARRHRTAELNTILRKIQSVNRPDGERSNIQVFRQEGETDGASDAEGLEHVGRQETILATIHALDQGSDDWSGWRARMRVDIHVEYYSVTFILDRQDLQTNLKRSPTNPPSGELARAYVSKWYRKIWDEFFDLFKVKGVALDFPTDGKFFECRGLVIDTADPAAPVPNRPRYPILDERIFTTERQDAKTALRAWVDQFGDVMSRILRLDRSAGKDQDANCVLSYVSNGRGVYASSMGRSEAELRSKRSGLATDATPERYLLLHHGLPRFEVGRILRRFHVLDELRCASAFYLHELVATSNSIRRTGDNIDAQLRKSPRALGTGQLEEIQRDLNKLTSDQRIGGLLYRINRSRYYARNFKLGMTDLRFAPIKGWEPYDAFMHRSLFPTIDHIDGIGQRFEALASRVQRLTEERDTAEAIVVQTRIANIQEIGEIIGWTAAAYYAGQIFSKFLHVLPEHCIPPNIEWADVCHAVHSFGSYGPDLFGMVISVPLAIGMYVYYKRKRESAETRRAS